MWQKIDQSELFSGGQYSIDKNLRFKTPVLRSDLSDYSDAYIVVKGRITVEDSNANNWTDKKLTSKNNSPFRSYISKISNTIKDNAEDLDIAMLMHNLLEYSDNHSIASGRFWNHNGDSYRINNDKTTTSKFS